MVANTEFYTGSVTTPPTIEPPSVKPSASLTVSQRLAVASGQTLYFRGQAISEAGVSPITNAGLIAVIPTADGATGITDVVEDPTIHDFTNTASGILSVEAKTGDAYGYNTESNPVLIKNQGVIQVVALSGGAYGLDDYGGYYGAVVDNGKNGLIAIWAAGTGMGLSYYQTGVAFTNEGVIQVTAGKAIGVYGPNSFNNSGTIRATDFGGDGGAIGVEIGFASLYHGDAETFTNSGLIKAGKAFMFDAYELSPAYSETITLDNSGHIVGAIDLSENGGKDIIVNTGSIAGAIECAGSSDGVLTNSGRINLMDGTSQIASVANSGQIEGPGVFHTATAFTNEAGGVIQSTSGELTIAPFAGGLTNDGVIEADGGVLHITGAVRGSGEAVVAHGTLELSSTFTQDVTFTGATGVLDLAKSQTYGGTVAGLSQTGGTTLDLRDIGFVSAGEATFSGTAAGGALTVTDGTHMAKIALFGDYMASSFVAASDGHGGTLVNATQSASPAASLATPG